MRIDIQVEVRDLSRTLMPAAARQGVGEKPWIVSRQPWTVNRQPSTLRNH